AGGFMIAAAVLKGHQLAYHGMPSDSLIRSVPSYVSLIVAEFVFGAWLIAGLYSKTTRLIAMLVFFGFSQVALWQALTGQRSCGCLGQVGLNPWLAFSVDFAILAGLALLSQHEQPKTIRTHPLRLYGFLTVAFALGVP